MLLAGQLPAPSHESCRVGPHAVPLGVGGWDGTPSLQTLFVQGVASMGRSASLMSMLVAPCPSQILLWQSPGIWSPTGKPSGLKLRPQVLSLQVRCAQSVSVPGQSVAT